MIALVNVVSGEVLGISDASTLLEARGWLATFGYWLTDLWQVRSPYFKEVVLPYDVIIIPK
jgi:hypothetical protein